MPHFTHVQAQFPLPPSAATSSESRLADLDSLRDRLESFKARQTAGGDSPRPRSVDSPIIRDRLRALGYLN